MSGTTRRAVIVLVAGVAFVGAYVFSFVFAQATPEPHELPVAVAGPAAEARAAERAAERAMGESFDVRVLDDAGAARAALRDREVYAALVLGGPRPRLLTAPAAGASAVQVAQMRLPMAAGVTGTPAIEQVRPLVGEDRQGMALNLVLFPLVIGGILVPLLLTTVAPAKSVRSRLATVALFCLLAGVVVAAIAGPALNALPGSFLATAGVAVAVLFAIAATNSACIAVLGPAGAGVAVLLFLVVGNVASGASVARELLPGFWRVTGAYLPPGAGADLFRSVTYFEGADALRPALVLAAFALVATVVALALGDRRPAPQGDPRGPTEDQDVAVR